MSWRNGSLERRGAGREDGHNADVLLYLLLTLVAAGALAFGALFLRLSHWDARHGGPGSPKPERRLAVVEQSSLDGRRKLVLIRRDDVEHLIMTGGPVDVIVETGIVPRRAVRGGEVVEAPAAVFRRARRARSARPPARPSVGAEVDMRARCARDVRRLFVRLPIVI